MLTFVYCFERLVDKNGPSAPKFLGHIKNKKYKTRGMSEVISNGENVKRKLETNTLQVIFTLNS